MTASMVRQIAMWSGQAPELDTLNSALEAAVINQQRLVMWRWLLGALTHAIGYAGAILNFVCVALPIAAGELIKVEHQMKHQTPSASEKPWKLEYCS